MSGGIFGSELGPYTDVKWVGVKDITEHPAVYKEVTTKNYLVQNLSSVKTDTSRITVIIQRYY